MTYDKLLELKKEVDELSIYYQALKEKAKIIDEKFYSNNLLSVLENDEEETDLVCDDDEISIDVIKEGSGVFFKLVAYLVRRTLIAVACGTFDIPAFIYCFLIIANFIYYLYRLFVDNDIKIEEEPEIIDEPETFEDLQEEKEKIDRRLEYVRGLFMKASREYEKLVAELNEKEYQEYLDYISEYLQYMLEHSDEILSEVEENYANIDEEILESSDTSEEKKKDSFRLYELK